MLLGTPRYMSPEQAHGAKRVDHRTDLWSLGVIAYLCVTGRLPFIAAGTGHILVKVCTEDPPKPSELIGHLPTTVDAFFAKALAKEPDNRFQTAREMGVAFAELAEVSLSTFSLTSSPGREGPPSWTGISGSYPGTPSVPPLPDAETSVDAPSARGRSASAGDGTLGAATKSPLSRGSRLGSRKAVIAAGAAAAIAVAALVGVASMRSGDSPSAKPASEPTASETASQPSAAPTAIETALPSATEAPEASSAEASDSAAPSSAHAAPHPRAKAKPKAGEPEQDAPPDKPEPAPKAKTKDGLDLFNGRF